MRPSDVLVRADFPLPDFDSLIRLGFATVDDHGRLSFTEAGLGCLRGRAGR